MEVLMCLLNKNNSESVIFVILYIDEGTDKQGNDL